MIDCETVFDCLEETEEDGACEEDRSMRVYMGHPIYLTTKASFIYSTHL
jgi:hypothetical protein